MHTVLTLALILGLGASCRPKLQEKELVIQRTGPGALTASPTVPTPTPEALLEGPLVAFIASDASGNAYLLILDLEKGITRQLQWGDDTPISVDWSTNGCKLNITLTTLSGIELVTTDLQGSKAQKIFTGGKRVDGSWATWPVLSPDGKWVAYTVLSGYQKYSGAEFQNIEAVAVDGQAGPFVLTTQGGAGMVAAWSPSGERLAYSDYDAAGVAQLYHSNPDGSDRVQLTHFTEPGTTIGMIRWSPAGKALAFTVYSDNETGSLWIASADGTTQLKTAAESGNPITDEFWWDEDNQRLAFHTERNYEGDHAIYWIDAIHGQVIHMLQASETPSGAIVQPFPFRGIQTMGFVGNKRLIFYDMSTGATNEREYAIDWNDLTGPVRVAPGTFQGEANCPNRKNSG